jgi:hypothetical protein
LHIYPTQNKRLGEGTSVLSTNLRKNFSSSVWENKKHRILHTRIRRLTCVYEWHLQVDWPSKERRFVYSAVGKSYE